MSVLYTMDFLHENITWDYFVFWGDQWSARCGLFQNLWLPLDTSEFFSVGQDGHASQHSYILVAFRKPIIEREH